MFVMNLVSNWLESRPRLNEMEVIMADSLVRKIRHDILAHPVTADFRHNQILYMHLERFIALLSVLREKVPLRALLLDADPMEPFTLELIMFTLNQVPVKKNPWWILLRMEEDDRTPVYLNVNFGFEVHRIPREAFQFWSSIQVAEFPDFVNRLVSDDFLWFALIRSADFEFAAHLGTWLAPRIPIVEMTDIDRSTNPDLRLFLRRCYVALNVRIPYAMSSLMARVPSELKTTESDVTPTIMFRFVYMLLAIVKNWERVRHENELVYILRLQNLRWCCNRLISDLDIRTRGELHIFEHNLRQKIEAASV